MRSHPANRAWTEPCLDSACDGICIWLVDTDDGRAELAGVAEQQQRGLAAGDLVHHAGQGIDCRGIQRRGCEQVGADTVRAKHPSQRFLHPGQHIQLGAERARGFHSRFPPRVGGTDQQQADLLRTGIRLPHVSPGLPQWRRRSCLRA
jgi:hypothetical protein